jgi:large subunit ribosomal protein L25
MFYTRLFLERGRNKRMKFQVTRREAGNKAETNKIRREGNIPAVIYSKGQKGEEVVIDGIAFKKLLNTIEPGTLASKKLTLHLDGKDITVIVKDIQYHPTTYNVLHLDFVELHANNPVTLNIPLKTMGAVDCAGVKLGGTLRQILRYVKVKCLPGNIPAKFDIDVRNLGMGQSMRISSIDLPSDVELCCKPEEIAVVVTRR